jgi:hypothetical protein
MCGIGVRQSGLNSVDKEGIDKEKSEENWMSVFVTKHDISTEI